MTNNTNIYKALLAAQKLINFAVKDGTNPHFRSKYETLESVIDAIKKPLNDNGIVIFHNVSSIDQDLILETRLVHAESGEFVFSSSPLIMTKNDMQQLGSASTYAKRQNLKALTNLPSEDDDGNSASVDSKPATHKNTQINQSKAVTNGNDITLKAGKQKGVTISTITDQNLVNYFNWMQTENAKKPLTGPLSDDFKSVSDEINKRNLVPF